MAEGAERAPEVGGSKTRDLPGGGGGVSGGLGGERLSRCGRKGCLPQDADPPAVGNPPLKLAPYWAMGKLNRQVLLKDKLPPI